MSLAENQIVTTPFTEPTPNKFFRLRWRFEFSDGRKEKIGPWDCSSDLPCDSAWAVDKTNLKYAIIEAECRSTSKTFTVATVDGQKYASMQWEAYSRIPGLGFKNPNAAKLRTHIAGLSILTADKKVTCWVNGKTSVEDLSEHDKLFKIHEHRA